MKLTPLMNVSSEEAAVIIAMRFIEDNVIDDIKQNLTVNLWKQQDEGRALFNTHLAHKLRVLVNKINKVKFVNLELTLQIASDLFVSIQNMSARSLIPWWIRTSSIIDVLPEDKREPVTSIIFGITYEHLSTEELNSFLRGGPGPTEQMVYEALQSNNDYVIMHDTKEPLLEYDDVAPFIELLPSVYANLCQDWHLLIASLLYNSEYTPLPKCIIDTTVIDTNNTVELEGIISDLIPLITVAGELEWD